ncbi:MAG TPA: 2-C-methyl-D-erythritol 2,4-cyclodiphosphate synthase [Candidatus Saccharicenans sp.]|nr:2-C-methyl-D-erythritol 2,4-cyclodiphosphate synthase [Candidatus Saccharicenans sp.]HQM73855.1 2-C-methyl-D-erythritol 2,4-cyclodiphosphate synthase [Candidatus Saccharicenans sp.]
MMFKVGLGFDSHRLVAGRPLIVGGVNIPSTVGCLAHSDGDVLIHALIDALLGAGGLGDIGQKFPDTDPAYKNISSLELLQRVMAEVKASGLAVVNADCLVILEKPRLAPFIDQMKERLCPLLGLQPSSLGIKAKTAEGLGEIGAGQAVEAWATVLLAG